jgi:hypothetical protein
MATHLAFKIDWNGLGFRDATILSGKYYPHCRSYTGNQAALFENPPFFREQAFKSRKNS